MWPSIITALFTMIDKVIPDPGAAAAAKMQALTLQASKEGAELEAATRLQLAQIGVNLADANGSSPMQRNGRPFILWVCGFALAWDTVLRPVATFAGAWAGYPVPTLPNLSTDQLYGLLGALLGLGTMRSFEKIKGAA